MTKTAEEIKTDIDAEIESLEARLAEADTIEWQLAKLKAAQAALAPAISKPTKRRGRPKGSKNKTKATMPTYDVASQPFDVSETVREHLVGLDGLSLKGIATDLGVEHASTKSGKSKLVSQIMVKATREETA